MNLVRDSGPHSITIIKCLSKYLPFKTLNQMYKTFVRSHLDYCDIIYYQAAKISEYGQILTVPMEEVERVQGSLEGDEPVQNL